MNHKKTIKELGWRFIGVTPTGHTVWEDEEGIWHYPSMTKSGEKKQQALDRKTRIEIDNSQKEICDEKVQYQVE